MNESIKTAIFAGTAAVLAVLAWATAPKPPSAEVFAEQGQPFFPEFKDRYAATSLQVVEFDAATARAAGFKVEFKNGKWVIPSHHDYPADAKERLAKTSAMVIGIVKEKIQTDRKEDHAACGVVDPEEEGNFDAKDRGKRVTLRDATGNALADLIIGRRVSAEAGRWFVRVPGQKRVYAVKMDVDLSTKFADWIETDLLKLDPAQIWKVVVNDHSVIEKDGRFELQPGTKTEVTRPKEAWQMEGLASNEEVNAEVMGTLGSTLDDLKIAGVRKKPELLTRDLKKNKGIPENEAVVLDLMRRGFFYANDGQLYSKEGELEVHCKDGVVYSLKFGFVFSGVGEEVTAGTEEKKEPGKDEKKDPKAAPTESRYLMITAAFDEKSVQADPVPDPPAGEFRVDTRPRPERVLRQEDEARQKRLDAAMLKWNEDAAKSAKQKTELGDAGKKRAKQLTDRFADWYYVIGAEAYGKVHLSKKDLVRGTDKPAGPELPPDDEDPNGHENHDHK